MAQHSARPVPDANLAAPATTGKKRTARIPLDYYKRGDDLSRSRKRLLLLALLAAVGYIAVGEAARRGPRGGSAGGFGLPVAWSATARINHGPVHAVHASFEHRCDACHGSSPNSGGWDPDRILPNDPWRVANEKCLDCHAGPVHHANMTKTDKQAGQRCGECHRDHQGRDANLTAMADAACLTCHANLKPHLGSGHPKAIQPNSVVVTGFMAGGHPDFNLPKTDDSGLKFNHALHMAPGLGQGYRLKPPYEGRYAVNDSGQVQLECASCHVIERDDLNVKGLPPAVADSVAPTIEAAREFVRIDYQRHCVACHETTVDVVTGDDDGDQPRPLRVPHGWNMGEIRSFLEGAIAADLLRTHPDLDKPRPRRMPGARSDAAAATTTLRAERDRRVREAEARLHGTNGACVTCHRYTREDGKTKLVLTAADLDTPGLPSWDVERPKVPDVWLPHGRFNHTAHRAFDCRGCHAQAYGPSEQDLAAGFHLFQSDDANKIGDGAVMIPPIKTCYQCHFNHDGSNAVALSLLPSSWMQGLLGTTISSAPRGVRNNCTECHGYHNRTHPLQGPGAEVHAPETRQAIESWIGLHGVSASP